MGNKILILLIVITTSLSAKIITKAVDYNDGNTNLKGYIAYDDSKTGKQPAVILVPEWWGLNDYIKKRAEQIAELGYFAFAADIYGNGKTTTEMSEAQNLAMKFYGDLSMTRERIKAAMKVVKANNMVDAENIDVIGYCFGGAVALELARSGADVNGVVGFHCSVHPKGTTDADKIRAKLLIQLGADDKFVPDEERKAFVDEMNNAKVNWEMITYSGTVHSFTNPNSGNDPSKGMAYNEQSDKRSWEAMKTFLKETLKSKSANK